MSEQQTTALTDHVIALPGGFRQVGVALYAHPAAAVVSDWWDDYVTLVRMVVTVQDSAAPGLSGSTAADCSTGPGTAAMSARRSGWVTTNRAPVRCG